MALWVHTLLYTNQYTEATASSFFTQFSMHCMLGYHKMQICQPHFVILFFALGNRILKSFLLLGLRIETRSDRQVPASGRSGVMYLLYHFFSTRGSTPFPLKNGNTESTEPHGLILLYSIWLLYKMFFQFLTFSVVLDCLMGNLSVHKIMCLQKQIWEYMQIWICEYKSCS